MKKTIVITGASDGIGLSAARQFKEMGHNVIVVGITKEKTKRVSEELNVPYHLADFSDLSQVKRLAEELNKYDKIDVLANNACGALNERSVTIDGFEKTFQVNYLASFLLTNLLIEKLCQSKATVIQTTSIAANLFGSKLNIEDLNNEKFYKPLTAYGNSKLENILFTKELHNRYYAKGINSVAFEPGIVRTNFASESNKLLNFFYHSNFKYLFTISPEKSSKRLVSLALTKPEKDFICGETYSKDKIMKVKYKDEEGINSKKLWDESEKMVKKYIKH